jgi:hypothetical protein
MVVAEYLTNTKRNTTHIDSYYLLSKEQLFEYLF